MSKFICDNADCKKFGVEDEYPSNRYVLTNGKLVSTNAPCPSCGKMRREVNENEDIPITEKNISIAKFSSASKEQKVEMLKKRSHDHFDKNVKEEKEQKIYETVHNFNAIK